MGRVITLEKASHTYTCAGKPIELCVSDVLRLAGIVKPYPESAKANVEAARDKGEALHDWTAYMDDCEFDHEALHLLDDDPELLALVLAYQRFREECEPEWSHVEEPFERENCAGTPDRIGRMKISGERRGVIVDLKTPKRAEKHWQIQLSGYQWLTEYDRCELYVVWLQADGTYRLLTYTPEPEVWTSALAVARWQVLNNGK
jgi:hypothetical protein